VAAKNTFKDSFATRRCLIPCAGWYEWRDEGGPRKQKYLFQHIDDEPLYMAGIWYEPDLQLVTLTIHPNDRCSEYHPRMPLFVMPDDIDCRFNASADEVRPILEPVDSEMIQIIRAD